MTENNKSNEGGEAPKAPAAKGKTVGMTDVLKAIQELGQGVLALGQRVSSIETSKAAAVSQVQQLGQLQQPGTLQVLDGATGVIQEPAAGPVHGIDAVMGRTNNCPLCGEFKPPQPLIVLKDINVNGQTIFKAGTVLPPGDKLAEAMKGVPAGALRFQALQDSRILQPGQVVRRGTVFTMSGEQLLQLVQREKKAVNYGLSGLLTGSGGHADFGIETGTFRYITPEERRPYFADGIMRLARAMGFTK